MGKTREVDPPASVQQSGTRQVLQTEDSYRELEALTRNAETILQRLELPYRSLPCAPATSVLRRPKPMIWRSGFLVKPSTGRFLPAATLRISRPGGPASGSRERVRAVMSWSTP